ncbi:MAG: hypothetical protein OXP69_11605, partial [Spirochaetaceae bacterium]|nr:hypothetical protein [Spirochaetaceae bacterium]
CFGAVEIVVVEEDQHGDSPSEATPLPTPAPTPDPPDDPLSGYLTAGDVDYFIVTVAELSHLYVQSNGTTDTFGMLLDRAGRVVAVDDDSGPGRNFALGHRLSPDVYYLQITGTGARPVGPYTLSGALNTLEEHGGSRETATYVALGSSSYGFMRPGDVDYFKFVVDRDYTRVAVYSTGGTDTIALLENRLGRALDVDDDSGPGRNFGFSARLPAGTYYVRIEGFLLTTVGRYRLFIE